MNAVNIRRGTWLVVILLPFVAGGIQRKSFIGALSATGGWLFYEEDHQLFLIEGKAAAQHKFERQVISRWTISAPTLRTLARDQLLSVDPEGVSERVRLGFHKGGHTEWNLHVESRENPKRAGSGNVEGDSAYSFRLSVVNGPFKGRWVGAEDIPEEVREADAPADYQPPRRRIVKLVDDPKKAVLFKYREAHYTVHHK